MSFRFVILFFIVINTLGNAQPDTSVVMEAVIIPDSHYAAMQVMAFDENRYKPNNLADLLSSHSDVFVKSYGQGSIATMSIRGSSSNQNLVLWNEVPIDNPMLGLADLSLIQSSALQNLNLNKSSSETSTHFQTIGGIITINNNEDSSQNNYADATAGYGSFGFKKIAVKNHTKFKKLVFDIDIYNITAENDFSYVIDDLGNRARNTHNHYSLQGKQSTLSFHPTDNQQFKFHYWNQSSTRQIPPSITQNKSEAIQYDDFERYMLEYRFQKPGLNLHSLIAVLDESNRYQDEANGVMNNNTFTKIYGKQILRFTQKNQKIEISSELSTISANTEAYQTSQRLNMIAFTMAYRRIIRKHLLELAVRKEWTSTTNAPVTSKLKYEHHINDKLKLQAYLSYKYRLPTLNELYWRPGGNLELQPEAGWSQELTFDYNSTPLSTSRLSLYHKKVDNWILWSPGANPQIWSPQNLTEVRSYGIDISQQFRINKIHWSHSMILSAGITKTKNLIALQIPKIKAGDQLLYTPLHILNMQWYSQYKNFSFSINSHYTGSVKAINQESLEDYWLLSSQFNISFPCKKWCFESYLKLENMLNSNYFIIERRPMPGFHFLLGAKIRFNY